MKKLCSLVLFFVFLFSSVAVADFSDLPDVSGFSYLELMYMLGAVKRALWACDEWTRVDVPNGVYEIGVDIPAGNWSIQPQGGKAFMIIYGSKLDVTGAKVDVDSIEWSGYVSLEPDDQMRRQLDIVLVEGHFIEMHGDTSFYKSGEKPDFGFKFD